MANAVGGSGTRLRGKGEPWLFLDAVWIVNVWTGFSTFYRARCIRIKFNLGSTNINTTFWPTNITHWSTIGDSICFNSVILTFRFAHTHIWRSRRHFFQHRRHVEHKRDIFFDAWITSITRVGWRKISIKMYVTIIICVKTPWRSVITIVLWCICVRSTNWCSILFALL